MSGSFAFSIDGSKFAAAFMGVAYVYDVASLTRLAAYASPSNYALAAWSPDSGTVLVSWFEGACVWDFSRPEAPSVLTPYAGPDHVWTMFGDGRRTNMFGDQPDRGAGGADRQLATLLGPDHVWGWAPSGASFFAIRVSEGPAQAGPETFALEERRAADGSLIRAVGLGPGRAPRIDMSRDAHALALSFDRGARVILFG